MLGLADRGRVMDALEHTLKGECAEALAVMDDLYRNGADPLVLLQDMLDLVHMLTRFKAAPQQGAGDSLMTADALARAQDLAAKLSMPSLGRAWQILLKGIGEVAHAEKAQAAAEMVLIRLGYAADLPDPGELLKKLREGETRGASGGPAAPAPAGMGEARPLEPVGQRVQEAAVEAAPVTATSQQAARAALAPQESASHAPRTVSELEALLRTSGFVRLAGEVYQYLHLVQLGEARLDFRPGEMAPPEMASNLINALREITGARWVVSVSAKPGEPTLAEARRAAEERLLAEARQHPAVAEILAAFPAAELAIEQN
jgi:DNA polymerase-3 subunit gamma/tau